MTQHWFKTVDFQPPSLTAIQQGLDILEQARTSGHSVYVHCKAGKGRSAVVTACYLMEVHVQYMYSTLLFHTYTVGVIIKYPFRLHCTVNGTWRVVRWYLNGAKTVPPR